MSIKFVKFSGPAGMYFARLVNTDGIAIMNCRGCLDEKCCADCVLRMRLAAAYDKNFKRNSTLDGKWFFNLNEYTGGEIIATSRMHSSCFEMEQDISTAKSMATD